MPNSFESSFNRALSHANRAFGVSVTLSRNLTMKTEPFTARRNNFDYSTERVGDVGPAVNSQRREYVLPTDKLIIDGQAVEPRPHDTIAEGAEVFEIAPPSKDKPAVELLPGGFEYLVHTQRVE